VDELEANETFVVQAEFSVQNTNYLNVLLYSKEKSHAFKAFSLEQEGMPCELNFNLDDLLPKAHAYGEFNRDLRFVSFTQSS